MKKLLSSIILLLFVKVTFAQQAPTEVLSGQLVAVTPKLSTIQANGDPSPRPKKSRQFGENDIANKRVRFPIPNKDAKSVDMALQGGFNSTAVTPTPPLTTFDGCVSSDNITLFGSTFAPPDPVLSVGPNHIVQMVNSAHRVFNKSGTSLAGPIKFSSIVPGAGDDGDPITLYDQVADRWLLLQFDLPGGGNNGLIFCISQTNDPAGAYFVYKFTTSASFPDYPHVAIWNNMYTVTTHEFNTAGTAYLGQGFYAMDRNKMLDGVPSVNGVRFQTASSEGGYLPMSMEGMKTPESNSLPTFFTFDSDETGAATDRLISRTFSIDFVTPANSVLNAPVVLNTSAFDGRSPSSRSAIEQSGTTDGLDAINDRMMSRIIYRRFDNHESVVMNHGVNVSGASPTNAGTFTSAMRWYELTRANPTDPWTINQQSTYAPTSTVGATGDNRWMGSPGIDQRGNIAIAYSKSSSTTFPSLNYAQRKRTDAVSTLGSEETLHAGTGSQTGSGNRWGDYSAMTTDPTDEETLWYTGEYYGATGSFNFRTRIGSFKVNDPITTPTVHFKFGGTIARQKDATPNPFIDYPIDIVIDNAPSQPVLVTLTSSGTATLGVDYDLLNATPFNLSAGTLTKTITLRVYNDAIGEPNEFLNLEYTLNANGGDAITGAYNQKHRVTFVGVSVCPTSNAVANNRPLTFCEGDSTVLSAVNVAGYTYVWKRNNVVISGATQFEYIAKQTGSYVVEITNSGCTLTSLPKVITTNIGTPTPTTVSRSIAFGTTITPGNGLQASANCASSNVQTYSGPTIGYDNNLSSGANPTVTFAGIGTITGKVKVAVTWQKKDGGNQTTCATADGGSNPFNNEVSFRLQSPTGTIINLINAATYASGGTTSGVVTTTFEDGGTALGTIPATGTFNPAQSLSGFNGGDPNGVWILLPNDNAGGDPLCVSGFSLTVFTSGSGGPATISWFANPTGGSSLASGTEYIPTDTAPGTYTYYAEANCTVVGITGCNPSIRKPATLTITNSCPVPSVGGTVSADATVCTGSNSGTLTLSGQTGNVIRWESSTDNFVTITTIANTTTSQAYSNLTQTTKYRAVVQNGTCPTANSVAATITVTNATVAGGVSADATVCTGSNSGTLTLSGHTGTILRWESSTDNFATITTITNTTTSQAYSNLTQTTKFRAVVQNGSCTAANSIPATITVTSVSVGGTVSADATVCSGANSGTLTLSGNSGNVVRWESSIDNFVNVTNIVNTTTSQNYLNITVNTQFRAVVQAGTCAAVNSSSASITVTPPSVGGIVTMDASVCSGTNSGTLTLSGQVGNVVRWESSTDNFATSTMITNTTLTQNYSNLTQTTKFRAVVQNGTCPMTNSVPATVTVIIVNATASNTGPYTEGSNITLTATGGTAYSWAGPNSFTSTANPATIMNSTTSMSGIYTVTVTQSSCTATATTSVTVNVVGVCNVTYDYVTGDNPFQYLFPLVNNMVIGHLPDTYTTIIATPSCNTIESIKFQLSGPAPYTNHEIIESVPHYGLFSNSGSWVFGRLLPIGNYVLTTTGYSQNNGAGTVLYGPVTTNFSIVANNAIINAPTFIETSLCAGSTFYVSFSASGSFGSGNQFQVQLSDKFGSFDEPTVIGTAASAGNVACTVPNNVEESNGYKVRVVSTNQSVVGGTGSNSLAMNMLNLTLISPTNDYNGGDTTKKATAMIDATNKILSPAKVVYQAGNAVVLRAGFEANANTVFKAEIRGCN
jgi:hypothetical protein